jgi:hypothetical protein
MGILAKVLNKQENVRYLVNFVDSKKRGYGPLHVKLMETEYRNVLLGMKVNSTPKVSINAKVITVVCGSNGSILEEDIPEILSHLKKSCEEKGIVEIMVPLQLLVNKGLSLSFLDMAFSHVFNNSNIKVLIP